MADISKITLPDGTSYDIKDATARAMFTDTTYENVSELNNDAGYLTLDTLPEIGGRNLVLNGEAGVTETTSSTSAATLSNYWALSEYGKQQLNEIKAERVVVSFEAKSDTAGARINPSVRGSTSSNIGYSRASGHVDLTTDWVRYVRVLGRTASADNFDCTRLWGTKYAAVDGTEATIYIRNVKLELGDCATDYAPAPEEYDQSVWYGTCSTAAATQVKVVTTTSGDLELTTGATLRVLFTYAQTYNGTARLNVDGTGAVDIYRTPSDATSRYWWGAGAVVDFVYDGSHWLMAGKGAATVTYYGLTKLSSAVDSNSTALAATPSAVKTVNDKIETRVPTPPTTAGTYTLQCTVNASGNASYAWV